MCPSWPEAWPTARPASPPSRTGKRRSPSGSRRPGKMACRLPNRRGACFTRDGHRKGAIVPRRKKNSDEQLALLEARVATAPCVPAIREKVKQWRDGGYTGVTGTTRILLNHWFCTDHRLPSGRKFAYHYFQREAVETLVFLFEVAGLRRHKGLVEAFATRRDLRLLRFDDFARYAVKMATGSGKTKVMSLA